MIQPPKDKEGTDLAQIKETSKLVTKEVEEVAESFGSISITPKPPSG